MMYFQLPEYKPNKPYSEEEVSVIRQYWETKRVYEIAEMIGRTPSSVSKKAKLLGLEKFSHYSEAEINFLRCNASIMTAKELSTVLNRHYRSITSRCRDWGIPLKKVGENHYRSKLSDQDIDNIRSLRDDYHLELKEIADKFDCHESHISRIVNYKKRLYDAA